MTPISLRPVLPGCYPDPSVCRAGDEYFLVASTFTLLPGLPVHRSTDLVNWELIGHVLPDADAIDLRGLAASDGVWAPTIRHHEGTFYVVYTVAEDRRGRATYITLATDPAGPWSRPEPLQADGIDPSLFFDLDGRCWFTAARDAISMNATGPGEIWMRELDLVTLSLVGDESVLWHGAVTGQWVEAPHIYSHDGRYHLIAAEGGTARNHAVTSAVADRVTGPYRTDPRSPLLTHRHLDPNFPVQSIGHADLVDTPTGEWVAFVLGVRPVAGVHVLGRETFIVGVQWEDAGPTFVPGPRPPGVSAPFVAQNADWVGLRTPGNRTTSLNGLRLYGSPENLLSAVEPAFVGMRQQSHEFVFGAAVPEVEEIGDFAGVVALQPQERAIGVGVRRMARDRVAIEVQIHDGPGRPAVTRFDVGHARRLEICSDGYSYFLGTREHQGFRELAEVPARFLSVEEAGGFLGALLGFIHAGSRFNSVEITDIAYREENVSCEAPRSSHAAPASVR